MLTFHTHLRTDRHLPESQKHSNVSAFVNLHGKSHGQLTFFENLILLVSALARSWPGTAVICSLECVICDVKCVGNMQYVTGKMQHLASNVQCARLNMKYSRYDMKCTHTMQHETYL